MREENIETKECVMANVPFSNCRKQQTGKGKLKIFLIFANLVCKNQLLYFCYPFLICNSQEQMAWYVRNKGPYR